MIDHPPTRPLLSLWKGVIPVSMAGIARAVAEDHGLTVDDLKGRDRTQGVVTARHQAMWRIRQTGRYSFPQIGRFFQRDHATVICACRAYERRLPGAWRAAA